MKLKKYKQLDIDKAIKGKDEYINDSSLSVEKDIGKITLFDIINDIRKYKTGKLLEDEENLKVFNSYMILKFLSMKESDVIICNYMNKYSGILSKEQMYFALLHLIEKDKGFYKITTSNEKDSEYTEYVCRYYECSKKEAKIYLDTFGDSWGETIKLKLSEERV